MRAAVSDNDKWSENMKTIMLENAVKSRTHLKNIIDVDDQLRTHNGDTLAYDNYKNLLKVAAQNNNKSNQVKSPRATYKACNHEKYDFISDLTETSGSYEET